MSFKTISQEQLGQSTAKNSQISTSSIKSINSGASTGPTITSIIVTDSGWNNLDDTAVGTSNSFIKIIGTGFSPSVNVFVGGTQVSTANVTFTSSTELRVTLPVLTVGTNNTISLFNSTGSGAIYASNLLTSGFPSFTTSSYASGTLSVSTQLLATGDGTLTYTLKSGSSLPSGLSLSTDGLITGTVAADSTSSFTILVNDSQNQTTQQDITLTITSGDPYFIFTNLLLQADGTSNNSNNGIFVDSSSYNYTVTPSANTPAQGSINPFGTGVWSNYFNGTNSYFTFPASTNYTFGTGDFTVEGWIYATSTPSNSMILTSRLSNGGANGTWGVYWNSGKFAFSEIVVGATTNVTSSGTYSANQWYHFAFVRSGSTLSIYVNGSLDTTGSSPTNFNNSSYGLYVGFDAYNQYFPGYISNLRIVKGTAVYTGSFIPSTIPLTAISGTQLLTCQSNRFTDTSTNLATATTSGTPSIQRFNPFGLNGTSYDVSSANTTYSGSYYFNSTNEYFSIPYSITNHSWYTSDYTIEAWVYPTDLSAWSYNYGSGTRSVMVGNQTTTDDTCYWSFGPQADGTVGFYYYTGATHSESSSQTISANSWSHIALTKNSAGIKIWVNGIGTNNIAISGTPQDSASVNLTVGQNSVAIRNIKGYISNLRIVKGTALYSSNFTPSTTPLQPIANTTLLLSGKNSGIYDATLQNDLQQRGDTKVQTAVYKYGTGSMYFDGTGDYLLSHNTNTGNFGTGDFTVEYWFKCGSQSVSYTTQIGTLDANSLAGGSWRFGTHVGNNPGVYFSTHNGSSFTDTIFTTTNYNDNTWHHLAVSRSGTTLRAFVDGTQVGSNQTLSLDLTARRLVIGAELWTPSHYTGYIDDLRITKGYARYTANFTPPSSALKNK